MTSFDTILGLINSDSLQHAYNVQHIRKNISVKNVYEKIPNVPHPVRDRTVCQLISMITSMAGNILPILSYADNCNMSGRMLERAISRLTTSTKYISRRVHSEVDPFNGHFCDVDTYKESGIISPFKGEFVSMYTDSHTGVPGCDMGTEHRIVCPLNEYQSLISIYGHRYVDIFQRGTKYNVDNSTISIGYLLFFGWCWTVDFIGFVKNWEL
jgi:hypothetical protein